ncbi:MAG: bifunctional 2-C-methyl-D-erythritol 4-phosphate cytidylyltransferase/2-C-methyl-D-erythritol 2,4-cyclodiphosphate synthase [Campylobacterales bacterium]|nr:bifunctional 2-C-methyl-D-erythritol 4-phosphate cytidylyltransferase/2-C-methyl-D-erythritol 2,4-cyclodiphosphate synthase [Campylobacterales bacterium]
MSDLTLILLSAGESNRFKLPLKKQWLRVGHDPLWLFVTNRLKASGFFKKIIIAAHGDEVAFMRLYSNEQIVTGGENRQASLRHALEAVDTEFVMVSDIARACVDEALIERLIEHKGAADVIVPALSAVDTIVYQGETIERADVQRLQTPQLSKTALLREALKSDTLYTDESSAIVASGGTRLLIEGDEAAHKITFAEDLAKIPCLQPPARTTLSGNGFDVHAFEEGRTMVLCGVTIDSPFGFKAHSDGDVAIHALIDALLGAAGLGDIGMLFPDTDARYKDIDSAELLNVTFQKLRHFGFELINVDLTIIAQTPRLQNYKEAMRRRMSKLLNIPMGRVNIKATTTEHLGFIGRKEGVGVLAGATLNYFDWTQA